MKKFAFVLIAFCLALGANAQAKITLAQNKPEIDAALKAYAAAWGKANNVQVTIKTQGGDQGDINATLKADYAAGEMADIFPVDGPARYAEWANVIADLSGEKWVSQTSVAFKDASGKVVGFPVAVEGWGMAYNADILAKAGVDPAKLNNFAAYKDAFAKIDAQKAKLGLNSVVSMAAGSGMGWVVAHHNLNSLLANGLKRGDLSVANAAAAGKLDAKRVAEYADWVELLFKYADKTILTTGGYDDQVGAFAAGKAAFLHQGNWVDGNLANAKVTFKTAFAPHGSMAATTDGIFVNPPAWYVVNKESKNAAIAKKFLNDMVFTEAGNDYMVNKAGMIPAFANVKLQPSGQLSKSVQAWAAAGKTYDWDQYIIPEDFRNNTLAPIYNQFALGQIDKAKFISLFTAAFATLKK